MRVGVGRQFGGEKKDIDAGLYMHKISVEYTQERKLTLFVSKEGAGMAMGLGSRRMFHVIPSRTF